VFAPCRRRLSVPGWRSREQATSTSREGVRKRGRCKKSSVSRYFKYKTRQALLADAQGLRLEIRLDEDLSPLRRPVTVGGRSVGNRLAIQPMEGCDGNPDGTPGELTL